MTTLVNNTVKVQDNNLQSKPKFVKNVVAGVAVGAGLSIIEKLDNISLTTMNNFGDVITVLTCGAMFLAIPQITKNAVFDITKGRKPHRSISNTGGMCIGSGAMLAVANISSGDTAIGVGVTVIGALVLAKMYQNTK